MRSKTVIIVIVLLLVAGSVAARLVSDDPYARTRINPLRVLVVDGTPVHNVGELQLHTGNWGGVGSWPGAGMPFSEAPSAQWPAGSGIEYLFTGGLWVGALDGGVPKVSTASFTLEFRPTPDPIDLVYRTFEGAQGGDRLPSRNADDDADGKIDEDPLDGRDNDGDGKIDEDFAAISDQMFSRWYTDDQPGIQDIYPEHRPLHLMVRENSYQWDDDEFDDFVGFDYKITNTGDNVLEDVYVGVHLDADAGDRTVYDYWGDDASGYECVPVRCTEYGPVSFDFGYIYDADGDGGATPGYFGVVILDHPTDKTGTWAPSRIGVVTYANFSGDVPFEEGGDPTNDFERYELMSSQTIERNAVVPRDYRMLVAVGPFRELGPGETLEFSMALVATPRDSDFANVANAVVAYKGRWFDVDGDPATGVEGRETPVPGPVDGIIVDPCRPGYDQPINWPRRDPIWINDDCEQEEFYKESCGYSEADSMLFRTGVGGREYQVHWWLPGQEPALDPVIAGVRFTPRRVNPKSHGDPLNAHITLPVGYSTSDVDASSLRLNGSIPGTIQTIVNDRKLIARFSRNALIKSVGMGATEMRVTWTAAGEPFFAIDEIRVIGGGPVLAGAAPEKVTLGHSPNPFNPTARITFELPNAGEVALEVYAANGKLVRRLASGSYPAGRHDVTWSGRDDRGREVASGIYFYRLRAAGETLTRKMVLVK